MHAEFRSKHPHTTYWLRLEWDGDEPTALLDELRSTGWQEDLPRIPRIGTRSQTDVGKPGTGPFRGWTPRERKANLAQARRILRRHGLTNVPLRHLTRADLL